MRFRLFMANVNHADEKENRNAIEALPQVYFDKTISSESDENFRTAVMIFLMVIQAAMWQTFAARS